jgi:hypothetical protein
MGVTGIAQTTFLYSAAQQLADFTTLPASYMVRVYQVSPRYGRGAMATAAI